MDVKQRFTIDAPADDVWQAFQDPALLVECLPGATLTEPVADNHLKLMFQVKLGPISAAFAGEGDLSLDDTAHTGGLQGRGTDRKSNSRVKGEAAFAVIDEGAVTAVELNVSFSITGKLAQFSREGIVKALADQLTRDFADNLQQALQPEATADAAVPAGETRPASERGGTPAGSRPRLKSVDTSSVNALSLVWRMIVSWWRRLLGKSPA
ncbi:SRPBCC family protein [Salinisphaera sp. T31B1]|uniref:CoxG family protein n=1 Tax=Salinisphaera sp. T31B1 TaxID=727963 RepID=UPI0033420C2C